MPSIWATQKNLGDGSGDYAKTTPILLYFILKKKFPLLLYLESSDYANVSFTIFTKGTSDEELEYMNPTR